MSSHYYRYQSRESAKSSGWRSLEMGLVVFFSLMLSVVGVCVTVHKLLPSFMFSVERGKKMFQFNAKVSGAI